MIKKTCFVLAAMSSLALTGCVTHPTPYQPAGKEGGYSEMALNKDIYKVTFHGNEVTSSETVNTYLLRRSAEVTIAKGYKYFVKLDTDTSKSTSVIQTPTTINTFGTDSNSAVSIVNHGENIALDSYTVNATIKMLHSNKGYPTAYNAKTVLSNFHS